MLKVRLVFTFGASNAFVAIEAQLDRWGDGDALGRHIGKKLGLDFMYWETKDD